MSDRALAEAIANCEAEPIHLPGAILPHGAMLVCDPKTLELRFWSRNFVNLTNFPGDLFPGQIVFDILSRQILHDLRNAAAAAGARAGAGMLTGVQLPWSDARFDVLMHTHAGATLIELEPAVERGQDRTLDLTRQLIGRLATASGSQKLFTMGARLVQALLGFDRVMVYRFQPDGSGKVVAEARMPTLDSFMGHHFPPGDIPPQARALYLANPIRSIPDAGYQPVPLDPPLSAGQAPVDMSHAQLRSVSPVHCEYLRNMGVGASLSISLIVEGELWGLVACHHPVARVVPPTLRVSAELFGHYFALQIGATERREAMMARAGTREQLDRLMEGLGIDGPLAQSLASRLPAIAALTGCHGAALWKDGHWAATLAALPEDTCRRLLDLPQAARPIWHSAEIGTVLPDAMPADGIAGVLVIRLSDTTGDALFLFRRSEAHEVDWAGAPSKMVSEIAGRLTLSPRRSFRLWREEVQGRSVPWSEHDLAIAEALRSWLRDALLVETEAMARERAEAGRRRAVINEELNHRIKNVLSLVKSIATQTGSSATSVAEYSTVLEGRLHALASAHDQSLGDGGGSLAALIEAEAVLHRSGAAPDRVLAIGPDVLLADKGYGVLALVIHEMMTNAMKYGALSHPDGRLAVTWALDPAAGLIIDWRESGGPAVVPPRRYGFGSRLIRSSVEYDLRGHAEIDFAPEGLVARFVIPGQHAIAPATQQTADPVEQLPRMSLAGYSVLVVEDQSLIAMDTEETLRQLGAQDIRLAASGTQALEILADFRPDLAVLDVNLGSETSEAVAEALIRRQSPFIFMTGYSDQVMLPAQMLNIPVVRKPVSSAAIALNVAAATAAVRDSDVGR